MARNSPKFNIGFGFFTLSVDIYLLKLNLKLQTSDSQKIKNFTYLTSGRNSGVFDCYNYLLNYLKAKSCHEESTTLEEFISLNFVAVKRIMKTIFTQNEDRLQDLSELQKAKEKNDGKLVLHNSLDLNFERLG
jgi:hypothetical protein